MTCYRTLVEILLDLSALETKERKRLELDRSAEQRDESDLARKREMSEAHRLHVEEVAIWAKLHLDDDAGRIEALCKAPYGTFSKQTAEKLCANVCSYHKLSVYDAKRLPPTEFLRLADEWWAQRSAAGGVLEVGPITIDGAHNAASMLRAQEEKLFPEGVDGIDPDDVRLICELQAQRSVMKDAQIARKFYSNKVDPIAEARKAQSRIRELRSRGKTTLPPRK